MGYGNVGKLKGDHILTWNFADLLKICESMKCLVISLDLMLRIKDNWGKI